MLCMDLIPWSASLALVSTWLRFVLTAACLGLSGIVRGKANARWGGGRRYVYRPISG